MQAALSFIVGAGIVLASQLVSGMGTLRSLQKSAFTESAPGSEPVGTSLSLPARRAPSVSSTGGARESLEGLGDWASSPLGLAYCYLGLGLIPVVVCGERDGETEVLTTHYTPSDPAIAALATSPHQDIRGAFAIGAIAHGWIEAAESGLHSR